MNNKIKSSILCILILFFFGNLSFAEENEIEPVHYAYSNYLGSGIYKTSGQNVTLINLPFSYELGKNEQLTYGLRLPLSIGFFDFSYGDIPELELPSEVGTLTFTPGIEMTYQYDDNLVIESYFDIGYAKNLTTHHDVTVHSVGLSSLYYFTSKGYDAIWVSRIYYAAYDGHSYDAADSYAAIQMGIDIGLPLQYQLLEYKFQPRVFANSFWYFNQVDFINPRINATENQKVTLNNSFELGITLKLDKKIGYEWAGIERLGLSYRFSDNISVFRLLFSFPI